MFELLSSESIAPLVVLSCFILRGILRLFGSIGVVPTTVLLIKSDPGIATLAAEFVEKLFNAGDSSSKILQLTAESVDEGITPSELLATSLSTSLLCRSTGDTYVFSF